jgi:hypothetical protein
MQHYHVECSMIEWKVMLLTVPCLPPLPQVQLVSEASSTIILRSSEDSSTWGLADNHSVRTWTHICLV